MSREAHAKTILGDSLYQRVADSRVLMIGAGGIGCELLKNLVLSGFKNIDVVDLDTIDLSNLNRQFLFRTNHIKKSKAHVARESALKFNPNSGIKINSHHANIKSPEFGLPFFSQFDLVMNALDNLDARRHVNSMCLAVGVPLIESGTTGYLGQAYIIQRGESECFDCQPKETPKTFPVCTIRSTPSAPIHCIVWAKSYLFPQLFGKPEDSLDDGLDGEVNEENAEEIESLKRETAELAVIKEAEGTPEYGKRVFEKVFGSDIERLLTMEDMWKQRAKPIPLRFDEVAGLEHHEVTGDVGLKDQCVWSLAQNFAVFIDSMNRLSKRLATEKISDPSAMLNFDKDDDDALDFVCATTNLRAHVFGIQEKSRFEVKSMAGNIIPAIATTNAIIAGIVVMQAFRILAGTKSSSIRRTYLTYASRRPQLLYLEQPAPPNPACYVCSVDRVPLSIDLTLATLGDLLECIQKISVQGDEDQLAFSEEDGCAIEESGRVLYDLDFDDNLEKKLETLGLREWSMINVTNEETGGKVVFILQNVPVSAEDLYIVPPPILRPKAPISQPEPEPEPETAATSQGVKRKAADLAEDTDEGMSKRTRALDLDRGTPMSIEAESSSSAKGTTEVVLEDEVIIDERGEEKMLYVLD